MKCYLIKEITYKDVFYSHIILDFEFCQNILYFIIEKWSIIYSINMVCSNCGIITDLLNQVISYIAMAIQSSLTITLNC